MLAIHEAIVSIVKGRRDLGASLVSSRDTFVYVRRSVLLSPLPQGATVMTGSNASESTHTRRDDHPSRSREGLFQSIGSMLFRPLSWVSSPRQAPTSSTHVGAETDRREAATTASVDTSATKKNTSSFAPAASAPFRGTHTLPSSLRVTPSVSSVSSPRSKWGSLNLAPNPTRSLASLPLDAHERNKPSALSQNAPSLVTVLGKRNPSAHMADAEHDEHMPEFSSSRKRRMVWDPEMGFVDVEDLAARRPPPPPPQNEAERILRALESMRTPLGDARRERIIRSQSQPSFSLSAPIPVPLPAPERESILAQPRLRSPAFRSIAPHSRSLRRSQLLRQSQVGLQTSLRSKLRQSVPYQDTQRDSVDEARVDEDLKVTDLEQPSSRTAKRRASKAKLSSKSSRAKLVKTENDVIPKSFKTSEIDSETTQPSTLPESELPKDDVVSAPRKHDKFEVRRDDEPIPKRSVLRQGASKTSRRHAPSGRITAFDDDEEDEDTPMPSGEELAKIKLPSSLFPDNFSFGEGMEKPASMPSKPLLERIAPPKETVTTTPSKDPKPGSVRFEAKPEVSVKETSKENAPPSSFFASAPMKTDSISMEKKSGPVPDFFGTKKATPASEPAASQEAGADSSKESQTQPDSSKKRDRDDEEAPAKKPAFSLNPTAPSFSFGKATEKSDKASTPSLFSSKSSTEKPTFSFGTASEKKDAPPSFSFGQPTEKSEAKSAFSFGSAPTSQSAATAPSASNEKKEADTTEPSTKKPAFSFNQPSASNQAEKPSFSFGSVAASKNEKPALSFAAPSEKKNEPSSFSFHSASDSTAKPSFSFGQKSETSKGAQGLFSSAPATDNKESQPLFGQAGEKKEESASATTSESSGQAAKPAFSFGQPPKSDAKPAFSFGTSANQTTEKLTETSSESQGAQEKPAAPLFGSTEKKDAPSFSFGQTSSTDTAAASGASEKKSAPSFSFGQTTEPKESKPAPTFSFGSSAKPKSDAPSFSFGQSSDKQEDKPAAPSFSFGMSAAKPDAKPAPTFSFGTSASPSPAFGATPQNEAPKKSTDAASAPQAPSLFGAPAPAPGSGSASPAPTFSFGGMPAASSSTGSPNPSFSFGATAPAQAATPAPAASTSSFGQPAAPPAPTTSFSFGAPNPSFSFGASSAPGGPTAPSTSFTFGSAPPSGVFQFGAPQSAPMNPPTATSVPAPAPTTSFSFGAPLGPAPSFTFGSMPASPAPGSPAPGFSFGTPPPNSGDSSGGGMFNLGSTTTPTGRQIKPLRQSRRRN